ncbi:hypothetical protein FQA39_LY18952 [Lamprigera yunnana]|nr:hypothetical protein FQA39_LY18952 [Lamprigera yunnana]
MGACLSLEREDGKARRRSEEIDRQLGELAKQQNHVLRYYFGQISSEKNVGRSTCFVNGLLSGVPHSYSLDDEIIAASADTGSKDENYISAQSKKVMFHTEATTKLNEVMTYLQHQTKTSLMDTDANEMLPRSSYT